MTQGPDPSTPDQPDEAAVPAEPIADVPLAPEPIADVPLAPEAPFAEPTAPYQQPPAYPPPPGYEQPPVYAPPPGYEQPPAQQWAAPPAYGVGNPAPFGVHPVTGVPYSDKSKLVAALLQILIPLGIGRMYIGDNRTGVLQLIVTVLTCGIGALWPFIDGIMMLVGDPVDAQGRPLRG